MPSLSVYSLSLSAVFCPPVESSFSLNVSAFSYVVRKLGFTWGIGWIRVEEVLFAMKLVENN